MFFATPQNIADAIRKLKAGGTWCGFCGRVKNTPGCCEKCTELGVNPKTDQPDYCMDCGSQLEESRIEYAHRHGGQCRRCYHCSKGITVPCHFCHYKHPTYWDCTQPATLG